MINTENAINHERLRRLVLAMQEPISVLQQVRFPVLAACQGASMGAALDLLSACDMRYATKDAYFVLQEINIGLMADLGSLQRLSAALPEGIVRELAFTGAPLSAERALNLGFVNEVLATHEELLTRVQAVAEVIASRAPLAVAASKQALNYNRSHSVAEALDYSASLQAAVFDPACVALSVQAMKTKARASYESLAADFQL